jgi:AP2-associated kinase
MAFGLQDFGKWGTNLLDKAQENLAPGVTSSLQGAKDLLKSGTKSLKKSVAENLGGFTGQVYQFSDPQTGQQLTVQEGAFLAEGGFGAVVKVSCQRTGKQYAMKKIACQEGVQVASSFEAAEREAKILQSLPAHPHIIGCSGVLIDRHGQGASTVKLLLELCPGGHLLDFMDSKNGDLSAKEILEPFAQVTDAVKFLHGLSPAIQHRDLKVENVLKGPDGRWKLCDFGSCSTEKVPAVQLTRAVRMKLQEDIDKTVTMLYRPPEMADIEMNHGKGFEINEQVDIWMLGCILYTLAFYRHPFQDNASPMAICNAKYFLPDGHPMARSQKLCGLIHWSLAADPKDRPSSAKLLEVLKGCSFLLDVGSVLEIA